MGRGRIPYPAKETAGGISGPKHTNILVANIDTFYFGMLAGINPSCCI
jgi:hypothetical protein